jgi:NifB/MoaA-like Fe-S oxidoreductase
LSLLKEGHELQSLLVEAVREHNVLPLTGICNLSCIFCSHKHNPPQTRAYSFLPLPGNVWSDLVQYLDPGRKIIIGESATRLREGEPFTHPAILDIIKKIRLLYPSTPIQVTTNASLLTEKIVDFLVDQQPLELVLSLNSASVKGRALLMNDHEPHNALAAPELLHRSRLPFHGSLVALPHLVGYEDLRQTIFILDQAGADTIRILKPGYTALSASEAIPPPGTEQELESFAAGLENSLQAVLLPEPPAVDNLEPVIKGVIYNSKAYKAGIMRGDLIEQVDDRKPGSRVDAFHIIDNKENPGLGILRNGQFCRINLNKKVGEVSGLVFDYDLDPLQVEAVSRQQVAGEKTLMLVSDPSLVRWRTALEKYGLTGINLKTVRSKFFGGSINCAGLLTAGDFRAAVKQNADLKFYKKIIIPAAAFNSAGYDLSGKHFKTLEDLRIPFSLA